MPDDEQSNTPSKSERKRAHRALQDLAGALARLPAREIRALPVEEDVVDELVAAGRMKASSARVRQLRFVARLLETADYEQLAQIIEQRERPGRAAAQHHHHLEALRDQLINADAAVIRELLDHYPQLPAGPLRHACNQARMEQETGKPRGAGRALFRLLAKHVDQADQ